MVYFNLYGNLGNLLFQYATAVSLGKGQTIGVTASEKTHGLLKEYGELFGGLEVVAEAPKAATVVRQAYEKPTDFPSVDSGDVLLDGYFQSEDYFDNDLVYGLFKPNEARVAALQARYGEWLSRPGVTGLSVRRGDYLRKGAWHPFVGERYFRDCLARLPDVRDFIVCSDGLPWCRRFFPKAFPDRRFLFVEGASVLDQLYVHALCANNVVSNSSFSWWGAWLAQQRRVREGRKGVALMPSMWYGYAPRKRGLYWQNIYFGGSEAVANRYSLRLWLAAHWSVFAERE